MTPQRITTFRIDDDLFDGLQEIKERDGIPVSEQVRRALRTWLESKGVRLKPAPRRVGARRKA